MGEKHGSKVPGRFAAFLLPSRDGIGLAPLPPGVHGADSSWPQTCSLVALNPRPCLRKENTRTKKQRKEAKEEERAALLILC